jgi:hypothetical protein
LRLYLLQQLADAAGGARLIRASFLRVFAVIFDHVAR